MLKNLLLTAFPSFFVLLFSHVVYCFCCCLLCFVYKKLLVVMFKTFAALTLASAAVTGEAKEYRNEIIEQDPAVIGEMVKTPRPHTYLKPEDLPASWDYRPLGLLTTDLNQHIPTYCGTLFLHDHIHTHTQQPHSLQITKQHIYIILHSPQDRAGDMPLSRRSRTESKLKPMARAEI
jgi:hypothetical protein